jgi:ABC-2 type transport system ATP-binding protein
MADAVEVEQLVKTFGDTRALDGVSFAVPEGTVLGLLGPNGAGKTTAVRILTTLLRPDSGRASVMGLDAVADAEELRTVIGLAGQYAAVDGRLTGRENLEMFGNLYHLPRADTRRRATQLLERFELAEAADRPSRGYSGGMRRRLDLAASLVNQPQVLFLDEPTTGLDPRSRLALWGVIKQLVDEGTTLLLTTQYLEEADRLADRIAVIDRGRVIAEGTSDQLKNQAGGSVLEVRVADRARAPGAAHLLRDLLRVEPQIDDITGLISMPVETEGLKLLTRAAERLRASDFDVTDISLRRPTLDDVFLNLTGRAADDSAADEPTREGGGRGRPDRPGHRGRRGRRGRARSAA